MKRYWRIALITVLVCSATAACQRRPVASGPAVAASDAAAIRLNNLGVAEMNRGRTGEALKLFQQAWRDDPGLLAARLNEGIALLNTQRFEEAREVLLDVTRRQPEDARAWYNAGILYRNLAEVAPAIDAFERVHRLDPGDADALYFLGQLHAQASRYEEATMWYERCLALDPLHLSAVFGLARANQLAGNDEAARRHLARFDELTKSGVGKPISLAYGEQGPYTTAEPVAGAALAPEAFAVRFVPITEQAGIRFAGGAVKPSGIFDFLASGACFLDFDADGRPDLLLPGVSRRLALYRNNGGGKFADVTARAGLEISAGTAGCTAADYDNDGWDDFAVGLQDRVAVYRNSGAGTFRDVTSELGIEVAGLPLGLVFVDYDHDGDVDLYVSRFSSSAFATGEEFKVLLNQAAAGNQLWRNNGNGSFTEQSSQSGLSGDIPGVAALPLDFNNDRAIDLVLTGPRPAATLLANSREGPFRSVDVWKSSFPAAAAGAVAWDFNKDGWMDLAFTHWSQPGLSVWKNLEGGGFERN
jgi:tetratricopeptide (TPR) repeat protein